MSSPLRLECAVYTRFLTGRAPSPYIQQKYEEFYRIRGEFPELETDPLERFLVQFSRRGPLFTAIADSYASRFRKRGALRKKLVLLLAILESVPPTSEYLDLPDTGGRLRIILRLGWYAVTFLAALGAGLLIIGPVHLLTTAAPGSAPVDRQKATSAH
jgi:hypothetical protein